MTRDNEDGWKTEIGQECENSEFNGVTRGVGTLSSPSAKTRDDPFGTRRTNSDQSGTLTFDTGAGTPGGIARQLLDEARKQLAYHKAQVNELETRIQELEDFTKGLDDQESPQEVEVNE